MAKVKISPEQYNELSTFFILRGYLAEAYASLVSVSGYTPKVEESNLLKIIDYIERLHIDNELRLEGMIEEGELE